MATIANTTDPCNPITSRTTLVLTLLPLISIQVAVILGNLLVITAVFTTRRLRLPSNFYLVSLAFVDLSVGLFILPFNIINQVEGCWVFSKWWCKLWVVFDVTLCTASILHLCTIALDRYRSVTGGVAYIRSRKLKHIVVSVICIGILSVWISCPPLLGWDKDWLRDFEERKECHLVVQSGYVVYTTLGSFVFPLAALCVIYYQVYCAISKRVLARARISGLASKSRDTNTDYQTDTEDLSEDQLEDRKKSKPVLRRKKSLSDAVKSFLATKRKFSLKKERNAAKTLGIIMGAFIICWVPFVIMYSVKPWLPEEYQPSGLVFELLTWLGYCNSAANPIIYTIFSTDFRKAFKRILRVQGERAFIRKKTQEQAVSSTLKSTNGTTITVTKEELKGSVSVV